MVISVVVSVVVVVGTISHKATVRTLADGTLKVCLKGENALSANLEVCSVE